MKIDETIVNILIHADYRNVDTLCQTNKQFNMICHNQYFIDARFNNLPFILYRPIKHTYNNIIYVHHLIDIAYKIMDFIKNNKDVDEFYLDAIRRYRKISNIHDLSNIHPYIADNITEVIHQLSLKYYHIEPNTDNVFNGEFERRLSITYNKMLDRDAGMYEVMTNQFYLNFIVSTGDNSITSSIVLTDGEMIEFLVNVFMYSRNFEFLLDRNIYKSHGSFRKIFHNAQDIENFIDYYYTHHTYRNMHKNYQL